MPIQRKSTLKRRKFLTSKTKLTTTKPIISNKKLSIGAKTIEWDEERAKLKYKFKYILKITKCEAKLVGCWVTNGLTFAHSKKRRYLNKDELSKVILCCIQCHTTIEAYPNKKMQDFVEKIIESRVRGNNLIMLNLPKTTVIYGATGVSKSAYAINYAIENPDSAVIFLTSEMSPLDIEYRMTLITNDITTDTHGSASPEELEAYKNINSTKTSHITMLNNREGIISIDTIKDDVQMASASGVSKIIVIIDSYTLWVDSLKRNDDDVINSLIELQSEYDCQLLLVCQEHRLSQSIKHFTDLLVKFSYERGGKTINNRKFIRLSIEKNRFGDTYNRVVTFYGKKQTFEG